MEAAASILRGDCDVDDVNDCYYATPPEKERRTMSLIVSCVAVAITILAVAMVGLTLGLSHMMDELSSKIVLFSLMSFPTQVIIFCKS